MTTQAADERTEFGVQGESRYPVCDQLRPKLEASGQQWLLELARWYESDWTHAINGGPMPSSDSVLKQFDPQRQSEIRTVLESIDTRYATVRRQQLSSDLQPTLDTAVRVAEPEGEARAIDEMEATLAPGTAEISSVGYEELDVTLDSGVAKKEQEHTQDIQTENRFE